MAAPWPWGVTGDGGDAVELPKFTGALARVQRLPLYGGGGVLHHVPRLAGADCFDGVAFGLVEVEQHVVAEPFVTQPLGPVRATIPPSEICRSTCSKIVRPAMRTVRLSHSIVVINMSFLLGSVD